MSILKDVLIPLLVSIVGSFATFGIIFLVSPTLRRAIYRLCSRIMRIDLEETFASRAAAQQDINLEITRAQHVHLLTGRGQELQTESFSLLLADKPHSRSCEFRVLLPSTQTFETTDWTAINDKMMGKMDPAYGNGLLKTQIEMTASVLAEYKRKYDHIEIRRFNVPHVGRIIITDRCAYFNPYNEVAHARHNSIFKFYAGGPMYHVLKRYFDLLWNNEPKAPLLLPQIISAQMPGPIKDGEAARLGNP